MDIIDFLTRYAKSAQLIDLLDIAIVSYIVYFVLKKIRGTSAERLLKGVAFLMIALLLSNALGLNSINYLLENITQVGFIALAIVFQPELRKMLERVGKAKLYKTNSGGEEISYGEIVINEVVNACGRLSDAKEGALIVFEREDRIKEVIASGVKLNAKVTSQLIRNVFYPKAPLHDGAMVIKDGKIAAAACILPLSKNQNISKDLGTRHRAAAGITEQGDSICVIVSEETGAISVSTNGMLKRHLSTETLSKLLKYELIKKEQEKEKENIFSKLEKWIAKITMGKED